MPADDKVIGGTAGVPLSEVISAHMQGPPKVDLLPADTASGARFGLDDDAPLAEVGEVPVGAEFSPAQAAWTPPRPRAALDPLTAPYEQVQVAEFEDPPPS